MCAREFYTPIEMSHVTTGTLSDKAHSEPALDGLYSVLSDAAKSTRPKGAFGQEIADACSKNVSNVVDSVHSTVNTILERDKEDNSVLGVIERDAKYIVPVVAAVGSGALTFYYYPRPPHVALATGAIVGGVVFLTWGLLECGGDFACVFLHTARDVAGPVSDTVANLGDAVGPITCNIQGSIGEGVNNILTDIAQGVDNVVSGVKADIDKSTGFLADTGKKAVETAKRAINTTTTAVVDTAAILASKDPQTAHANALASVSHDNSLTQTQKTTENVAADFAYSVRSCHDQVFGKNPDFLASLSSAVSHIGSSVVHGTELCQPPIIPGSGPPAYGVALGRADPQPPVTKKTTPPAARSTRPVAPPPAKPHPRQPPNLLQEAGSIASGVFHSLFP